MIWKDLTSSFSIVTEANQENSSSQPMNRGRLENAAPWLRYAVDEALSCKSEGHGFDYQ